MATQRGNTSTYRAPPKVRGVRLPIKSDDGTKLIFELSDEELADAWKRSCRRDPFEGLYEKLKKSDRLKESLNCRDLRDALVFLHEATGDDDFIEAANAMKRHGLTCDGVKKRALNNLSAHKSAVWAAMPHLAVWVEKEKLSPLKAAKIVAARLGVPGASFESVITALRKAYPKWKKSIADATLEVGKTS